MRFVSWLVVLVSGFAPGVSARQSASRTSGIYVTAADYDNRQLTAEGDCGSKAHKLELHDVLNKPYIHVTHEGRRQRYDKDDLFGFRACDGNDYRFASNLEYRIVEARELFIYARETQLTSGKSWRTVIDYSFSVGSGGKVLPLTLDNLKRAFPDNHAFHDSLDEMFGGGQDLALYDQFHKMFKVNRLLIATSQH